MAKGGKFNIKLFILLILIVFIVHVIFLTIIMNGSFSSKEEIVDIPVENAEFDIFTEPEIIE